MTRQAIEQAIKDAGWQLDGGFVEELLVGNDYTVSILAPRGYGVSTMLFLSFGMRRATSLTG